MRDEHHALSALTPSTYWLGCVGARVSLKAVEYWKLLHCRGSNPAVQLNRHH
jgi:hypothetical protein